ncbi:MAG: metal-dependent hydrolase [Anaerolineae bacterium]|jgi:L-ascorbate metabolism protein UlaG (beta-lactamase superfamily)|nr:metal-dependent hydrolase [Anaerolineae bacterium]
MISIKWLGHSAFALDIDGHPVLIDPFLTGNPLAAENPATVPAELILLSHGHGDHVGDTVSIATRTGALVCTNFEIGNWLMQQGVDNVVQGNTGGTYYGTFCDIKWTIAFHSSSLPDGTYGGQPGGFIISAYGKKLYFAGDTALFGDMKLYGDEGLDVAFLPVGDLFTMGIEDSIKAIQLLRPRYVIPMHYNTFPPIVQDAVRWAAMVNRDTDAGPIVLDPGGVFKVD